VQQQLKFLSHKLVMMVVKLSLKRKREKLDVEKRSVQQQQPKFLSHKLVMMVVKLSLKRKEERLDAERRRDVH